MNFLLILIFVSVWNLVMNFVVDVLQQSYICKKMHNTSEEITGKMLDRNLTFLAGGEEKYKCFLQRMFRLTPRIDEYGKIKPNLVTPLIRNTSVLRSLFVTKFIFESNVLLVCNYSFLNTNTNNCSKSVKAIECAKGIIYLYHYGYMDSRIITRFLDSDTLNRMLERSVAQFQAFFDAPINGKFRLRGRLDTVTLETMDYPRCGVRDVVETHHRRKRYALYQIKWKKTTLTYAIAAYTDSLPRDVVDFEIARAFKLWTTIAPLKITKTYSADDADIVIEFRKGYHGDPVPFDGPGVVLAHTFYPVFLNDGNQKSYIHFDDSEEWTSNSIHGTNLFQIALHEIGHCFGLKHSGVKESVMWPGHKRYNKSFSLHVDDIRGIRALYGSRN